MMTPSLQDAQKRFGGVFDADRTPISFGNDGAAIQAAYQGVALYDRSHWGRLSVSGADRLSFLHNQSTNDFKRLQPGQGCDTVFVTSTARTIDLATAYVSDEAILVLVSANRRESLLTWLDRYIFFGDKVTLSDVTDQTAAFSLLGPDSEALLEKLGAGAAIGQPYASHLVLQLADQSVRVAVGSGLALPGYTLVMDASDAAVVWQTLAEAGAVPLGEQVWDQLRIQQGRPVPDRELTEDYNPLEAGLWQTISFSKGCYIGQETIARLDTYKGVKQKLWGIRLSAAASPGDAITLESEKVGILTSLTDTPQGPFGLAYVRTKAGGEGLKVQVAGQDGELVDVPFLRHDRV